MGCGVWGVGCEVVPVGGLIDSLLGLPLDVYAEAVDAVVIERKQFVVAVSELGLALPLASSTIRLGLIPVMSAAEDALD